MTRVCIDGRQFIVTKDEAGSVARIVERKKYAPGLPWESVYNAPYWHAAHHKVGGANTIVARIISAAATAA